MVANGCPENLMDAALLQHYLGDRCEYKIVEGYAEADVILVLGCSVTQHMEDESRDLIAHLEANKRPGARLEVTGCIAKVQPDLKTGAVDDLPLVAIEDLTRPGKVNPDLFVNAPYEKPAEITHFLTSRKRKAFQRYTSTGEKQQASMLSSAVFNVLYGGLQLCKDFIESRISICNDNTFGIKASTGCQGRCSYCSIRFSRGAVNSKPIDDLMVEFQQGLDQGYRYFALMGTDLGDYGKDLGSDLIHLLERMVSVDATFSVKLRNVSPRWLIPSCDRLCDLLESGKIGYIQSPVQSGSDRILEIMKRGYRAGDFLDAAAKIHRRFPSLVLRTQLLTGFPTETHEEFKTSEALVDSGLFDYVDVFRFTARPGTLAATIGPEVPFNVVMRRYRTLLLKALFKRPGRKLQAIRLLNRRSSNRRNGAAGEVAK